MSARKTRTSGRARRTPEAHGDDAGDRADDAGDRTNDALTNLIAYALTLDTEYHRLDDRAAELVSSDSEGEELRTVLRERDEVGAQREAFRRSVTALREQAGQESDDPA
jgi:hypothetical protein